MIPSPSQTAIHHTSHLFRSLLVSTQTTMSSSLSSPSSHRPPFPCGSVREAANVNQPEKALRSLVLGSPGPMASNLQKHKFSVISRVNQCFTDKVQSKCELPSQDASSSRRHFVTCTGASIAAILTISNGLAPLPVWADDKSNDEEQKDGIIGALKTLFDPNEKTKSGKVLPKAYLKSAKEVVKTLRESLNEDPKDNAKFRRTADAAKESIREYLGTWRGQGEVAQEESYVEIEKAIRSLAGFYSKAGPSAPLPEQVKSQILNDLNTAEEFF